MKHTFLILAVIFSLSATAQPFEWADHIAGGSSYTVVTDLDVNKVGRTAVCGYMQYIYSPTIGFTTATTTSSFTTGDDLLHGFVASIHDGGELNWMITYRGDEGSRSSPSAVKWDHAHKCLYVVGKYRGAVDFNYVPFGTNAPDLVSNGIDGFVAKYSFGGSLLWVISIGDDGNEDAVRDITYDAAGYVYVTGVMQGTVDFDPSFLIANKTAVCTDPNLGDLFVAKYASNSDYQWCSLISPDQTEDGVWPHSIDYGSESDGVYVALESTGTYDVNPLPPVVLEASPSSIVNLKVAGGTLLGHVPNHGVYTDVFWDNTTSDLYAIGHDDESIRTYRMHHDLAPVWERGLPRDGGWEYDLSCNNHEQFWMVGRADGIDLDPGLGYEYASSGGFMATYLKSNGDFSCYAQIGANVNDAVSAVRAEWGSREVSVGGYFNEITDFDIGAGTYSITPLAQDAYVAHYTDCNAVVAIGVQKEPAVMFDILGRPVNDQGRGWVYRMMPDGEYRATWME